MSDRLKELLRQRELLKEHLAWLDRELTREEQSEEALPAGIPAAAPKGPSTSDVEAILARYRQEPESIARRVRVGLFLYVAVTLLLAAAGLGLALLLGR